jgi:short-subunit dehydrogenase
LPHQSNAENDHSMAPFAGKTIVITGASDGIGAELARQLATQRPNLVLAARRADALDTVAERCRSAGAECLAVPTDVADQASCAALIAAAVERFGGIDVLVANAGVSGHARLDEVADLGWYERMMRVNLFGTVWCCHAALPHLKAARGLIVGVSSLAGKVGVPGRTAYSASKFAQAGFLEALRAELAEDGVAVTIVYPGVVATRIRYHGFGPDGAPAGKSGLDERGMMPVETCARQIARAMAARRRELIMTAKGKLGPWLKLIAPRLVDRMALKALKPAD